MLFISSFKSSSIEPLLNFLGGLTGEISFASSDTSPENVYSLIKFHFKNSNLRYWNWMWHQMKTSLLRSPNLLSPSNYISWSSNFDSLVSFYIGTFSSFWVLVLLRLIRLTQQGLKLACQPVPSTTFYANMSF